jgi:hypothetical protein
MKTTLTEATRDSLNREFSDIPEDIREFIISQDFTKGDREVGHLAKPLLQLYKKSPDKDLDKLPEVLGLYKKFYFKKELSKFKFPSINQYSSLSEFYSDVLEGVDPNPIIFDDGEWSVRELNSKNVCVQYAPYDDNQWCTAIIDGTYYETAYNKNRGDLYLIYKNDKIHSQMFVDKAKSGVQWMLPGDKPIEDYDETFKDTTLLKFFYDNNILVPFTGLKFRGRRLNYEIIDGVYHFDNLDLSDMNPKLKSLKEFQDVIEGSPYVVRHDFMCDRNSLTTVEYGPLRVGGNYFCQSNNLFTLKGVPQVVEGRFWCHRNCLISLKGGPKRVGRSFWCHDNRLETLEGAPEEIEGNFDFSNNPLTSLKGAPQIVIGIITSGGMYDRNPSLQNEIENYKLKMYRLRDKSKLPIREMAEPTRGMKTKFYYHGTQGEEKAEKIWKDGLHPKASELFSTYKGLLTPMLNRVYLTSNIAVAWDYADIGGDAQGYVFEIPGTELKNVFPDEDNIASAYWDYKRNGKNTWLAEYDKYLEVTPEGLTNPEFDYLHLDEYDRTRITSYIEKYSLGGTLLSAINNPDSRGMHGVLVGKLIYPHLKDEHIIQIIEKYGNVSHAGVLMPSKMWRKDDNSFTIRNMDEFKMHTTLINSRDIETISLDESRHLQEMAYPDTFNLEEFKALNSGKAILSYCKDRLQLIGSGSARFVFQVDDDKVIKIAKNMRGIAQNSVEAEQSNDTYLRSMGIVAETYEYHPSFMWIEMEKCHPVSEEEFATRVGIRPDILSKVVLHWSRYYKHYIGDDPDLIAHIHDNSPDESEQYWLDNTNWNNEFIQKICKYMLDFELLPNDFGAISAYGINSNGDLIVIDFGLTPEIWDVYYMDSKGATEW